MSICIYNRHGRRLEVFDYGNGNPDESWIDLQDVSKREEYVHAVRKN